MFLYVFKYTHSCGIIDFFFFQAEDGIRDLVRSRGSEMCIRDRHRTGRNLAIILNALHVSNYVVGDINQKNVLVNSCLLYTSDAADERSSVDLGGRRIIKKK